MRGSLRARMTLGFTLSFGAFAFGACFAFFLWSRHAARLDAEERVSSAAQHLVLEWKGRTPRETFEEVHEDARLDQVSMVLVGLEGRPLASDGHPALPWPVPAQGWIAHVEPAENGSVVAGMAWEPIAAEVHGRMVLLVAFAILATGVVGGAAWFLVGRTLRPIDRLADGADAASSDPLRARLRSPSQDAEITHLVATLNGFLARLGESARNREQFYASAAHELRTPLAVLSAEIEVTLSRSRTPEEHEETLRELQFQTRRLTALTEGLLTLNRLEMTATEGDPETSDPADLAASTLAALRPSIQARRLSVETDFAGERSVTAPATHLAIVVRNLVENAVRHTPEGGRVQVSCGDTLRVANDFPAERPLELERMFEPFVQADVSRSGGGNGLGLAICRRVAAVNGWSLSLRREDGQIVAEVGF